MNRQAPGWVDQPQEIPDEEHEQVVARVCAIDVGKQAGKVCTRVPHREQPNRRVCKVWDVAATTNDAARRKCPGLLIESAHLACRTVRR